MFVNTVMMPLPAEGLDSWLYPHASFKMKKTRKEGDTTVQEDTLGMVYVPLDGLTFMTQDNPMHVSTRLRICRK